VWTHLCFSERLTAKLQQSGSFIPSAQTIRLIALGFDQLVADFYWLAFVGYIGDSSARAVDHSVLADRYLDLITGLDPHFVQAYWFCAFTVGSDAKRPLRANAIIQRGIKENPDNWYLPYIAGINMYLFAHDEIAASKYYAVASKFPSAPKWLGRQAAILAANLPSTIKQICIWEAIYTSETTPLIRRKAKEKLVALWEHMYGSSPRGPLREKAQSALSRLRGTID